MSIIEQLKRDEGFRGEPYYCTENKLTIAYGRNLEQNPLTEEEGEHLLKNDINKILDILYTIELIETSSIEDLTPREAVWVNMAYQMGVSGTLRFKKAIKAYKFGDYRTCAEELLDSRWATQTPNRSKRVAEQMLTGEWQ